MAEATSALTFQALIIEVAEKLGFAYYGANGDEAAQVPTNTHDLDRAKRLVNKALGLFVMSAPATGWRWQRPTGEFTLWPSVAVNSSVTATGVYDGSTYTTITASADTFYSTMEGKNIVVTDTGTFEIVQYVSATVVKILGNHAFTSKTFSIAADGNYTLPNGFAGPHTGDVSFEANTNTSFPITWTNESSIRKLRENVTVNTGEPQLIAIRVRLPVGSDLRRRYEIMAYPTPDSVRTIEFPYDLHFDSMVNLTDTPPTPIGHDETIRQACRMVAEADVDDMGGGPEASAFAQMIQNSHNLDARTGPRRLGYFGNPDRHPVNIQTARDLMRRQNVTYNS